MKAGRGGEEDYSNRSASPGGMPGLVRDRFEDGPHCLYGAWLRGGRGSALPAPATCIASSEDFLLGYPNNSR